MESTKDYVKRNKTTALNNGRMTLLSHQNSTNKPPVRCVKRSYDSAITSFSKIEIILQSNKRISHNSMKTRLLAL